MRFMKRAKLKKAPLREVIFELFWDLQPSADPGSNPLTDPGYQFAIGVFANEIRKEGFPVVKRPLPAFIQVQNKPEYQFWVKEATWPVVQLGPGMITVNDTDKNYSWDDNFFKNIKLAFNALQTAYQHTPLKFNRIKLQYVNVVEIPENVGSAEFIESEFLVSVASQKVPGKRGDITLVQTYIQEDGSRLVINIQTGINRATGKQSLIWTISVEQLKYLTPDEIFVWLDKAHNLTSNTFVDTINPKLYDSFNV
jgi:uncharacterized protein (TIGR04255 family)